MHEKRGTKKRLVVMVLGAVAALVAAAVPVSAIGETPETVVGGGSDAMNKFNNVLAAIYQASPGCEIIAPAGTTQLLDYACLADKPDTIKTENYFHDEVYYSYPLGGGSGIKQLCQQGLEGVRHLDFAAQAKTPSPSDCHHLNFVAVARDAMTWQAFPGLKGSPAKKFSNKKGVCKKVKDGFCLTQAQLKKIFITCQITNWKQLGGPNAKIAVYTGIPGAGRRQQWDAYLGGDSSTCIPEADKVTHQTVETFNPGILKQPDAKRAIAMASYGTWVGRINPYPDGSKIGALDGVIPNKKTISSGQFPFNGLIFNVYRTAAHPAGPSSDRTLLFTGEKDGWLCKPAGQHSNEPFMRKNYRKVIEDTISSAGFAPLPLGPIGGGVAGQSHCRLFPHPAT